MGKLVILLASTPLFCLSQSKDYIKPSDDFCYGESMASTESEANKGALAQLVSMIVEHALKVLLNKVSR